MFKFLRDVCFSICKNVFIVSSSGGKSGIISEADRSVYNLNYLVFLCISQSRCLCTLIEIPPSLFFSRAVSRVTILSRYLKRFNGAFLQQRTVSVLFFCPSVSSWDSELHSLMVTCSQGCLWPSCLQKFFLVCEY